MRIISLFFLFIASAAGAQQPTAAIKDRIENVQTEKHVNIPGTKIFMISPPLFLNIATGFQKGNNSLITVEESTGDSYFNFDLSRLKEAYENMGVKVLNEKDLTIQGHPAKFISFQYSDKMAGCVLIFGDSSFNAMVTGAFPLADKETESAIFSAFHTIWYDKEMELDPLDITGFTADQSVTKFKYFGYNKNAKSYAFFVDGVEDKTDKRRPYIVALKLPADITKKNKGEFIEIINETVIETDGLTNVKKKNVSTQTINGYTYYEEEVHGLWEGEPAAIYHCIIDNGSVFIFLKGIAKNDLTNNLSAFRQFTRTVRIK